MFIHGRDVHFLLTVGATKKVARLCPDNDIQNIGLVFEAKDTDKMIDTLAILSEAMSEGYEKNQKYNNPDYVPHPITADEIMCLTIQELSELQNELMNEIDVGMKTEVDAEPEKSKVKKTDVKVTK